MGYLSEKRRGKQIEMIHAGVITAWRRGKDIRWDFQRTV